jgi:hypothetical protein
MSILQNRVFFVEYKIIPEPSQPSRYFVFAVEEKAQPTRLHYNATPSFERTLYALKVNTLHSLDVCIKKYHIHCT